MNAVQALSVIDKDDSSREQLIAALDVAIQTLREKTKELTLFITHHGPPPGDTPTREYIRQKLEDLIRQEEIIEPDLHLDEPVKKSRRKKALDA